MQYKQPGAQHLPAEQGMDQRVSADTPLCYLQGLLMLSFVAGLGRKVSLWKQGQQRQDTGWGMSAMTLPADLFLSAIRKSSIGWLAEIG